MERGTGRERPAHPTQPGRWEGQGLGTWRNGGAQTITEMLLLSNTKFNNHATGNGILECWEIHTILFIIFY